MARISASRTERILTHIYVRDSQKRFVRPCWSTKEAIYCGTCLKGTVQPVVGEICTNCSSTVERVLEVAPADKLRDCRMPMEPLLSRAGCRYPDVISAA
jgi:hypothetical protein